MTYFGALNCIPGLKANADLSSYQFRFVTFTSGKVTYCSTTGEPAIGVLQDKPSAANVSCAVAGFNGTLTKVVAGAAVSQGAWVMTDTVGRAITHTTGKTRLGLANSAATAAGQLIEVVLLPYGIDISPSKGTIQLPLGMAREIVSNDIGDSVADESGAGTAQGGGYLTNQTTPLLQRVNVATDKCLRLNWAASDSTEIQWDNIAKPQDLDHTADMTVHFMGYMAGATDTPTLTVAYFEGIGDTDAGGATGALGASDAEVTRTIAAANIAAAPGHFTIGLTPGAHTTDILYLTAAWVEYTRKVN